MNLSSRSLSLSLLTAVSAISLLYLALFISPELYHFRTSGENTDRQWESAGMTIRVEKFTPEVLLTTPRRSPAVPNAAGTHALYTQSTYSFESHSKSKEIRLLDLRSSQITLVTNENKTGEPHWLEDDILYLKEGEKGITELIVADSGDLSKIYTAAIVPGPVSDAKLKVLEKGKVAIVFAAMTQPDGTLYNPENEPKKHSTGRLYDSVMVRHWDKYVTPNRNSLWYGIFLRSEPHISESKGRYSMSTLVNALRGTQLESPIPPFPGSDHFDISSTGIVFVAKAPNISRAFNTKCNFYYLAISNFATASHSAPHIIEMEGYEGAASSPVFSPHGSSVAFLKMKKNGYEADKNHVIIIPDLSKLSDTTEAMKSNDGKELWDRSPSSLIWSNDGQSLYLTADDEGLGRLFKLDVTLASRDMSKIPTPLTSFGSVSGVHPLSLASPYLLLSSSSLTNPSFFSTINPSAPSSLTTISSLSQNGSALGLSVSQVSSIHFAAPNYPGTGTHDVHALVVRPSSFSPSSSYPLALLIHGGPQSAWSDSWSTRWNPVLFAEQGYIVVCPNPTGSTGYGQAFTDAIQNNWGGAPYTDLEACMAHVATDMPYVDLTRAVALGASYGGYMINWMNGHPLGRKFKAFVCHDGVFSMSNQLSSDEQYFPNHDLGGPPFDDKTQLNWDRWDPSRFVGNWETPQLVIHNELDYRLPVSEGLAAFNVLQERGLKSRFLTFPDENHWVLGEENSRVWHRVVLEWVNYFVGLSTGTGTEELGVELVHGNRGGNGKVQR
ncbi:hypothetical protein MMC11_000260 [Xylographa trunciseda]|nr:hypothetical protein [Xylographa trunciseda]